MLYIPVSISDVYFVISFCARESSALTTWTVHNHMIWQQLKMASQSTGIQQLLKAEKQAAEKVSEARKRKYMSYHEMEKER